MLSIDLPAAFGFMPNVVAQLGTFEIPQGLNLENILVYSPLQHDLISHLLTLGVGAMAVGFVYFLTTKRQSAPAYQPSSVLSAIVMVSAFLILFRQLQGWQSAFAFDGEVWRLTDSTFSNGYRYLNWSIDVPCLLTQMLFVVNVTPAKFRKTRTRFVASGLLMIYTGYIGQYFELTSIPWFMLWGFISTIFYVYILYLVGNLIFRSREGLPRPAYNTMGTIWWVILISWTLYPLAYLVPLGWQFFPEWGGWAGVTRQFLFTVADIFSKVIYGVLLTSAAQACSVEAGYEPALQAKKTADNGQLERETKIPSRF
ncbi:bacteriorhodopsin [Romeria aff. gracilis LEGE 07310]|uniref:Bacteriorhodopsin n=1 Tax=Vasconcelosia minhoensis LEGE 07310 TaxID=915328 RepID=A0A8J7AL64_9CYAN|nr:bacteriorhodopsin [Romeria gracilis]MBE9076171.1 bacteriorhodopsin [Romeria aff. gracilis LEGE 07310]